MESPTEHENDGGVVQQAHRARPPRSRPIAVGRVRPVFAGEPPPHAPIRHRQHARDLSDREAALLDGAGDQRIARPRPWFEPRRFPRGQWPRPSARSLFMAPEQFLAAQVLARVPRALVPVPSGRRYDSYPLRSVAAVQLPGAHTARPHARPRRPRP